MTREEIVESVTLPELCRRYGVELNRQGFAKCPFHNEKTASFKAYKRDFHCFGCQAHGSVFDFIMLMENVDFKKAFEILGGTNERPTARARIRQYHAEKREAKRRAEWEETLREMYRTSAMICTIRTAMAQYEPLSDEWGIAARDLTYYEGLNDIYIQKWWELKKDRR